MPLASRTRARSLPRDRVDRLTHALKSHSPDPSWRDLALCPQTDPEIFFPEKGSRNDDAMLVCNACPAVLDCLAFALTEDVDSHGIWGMTTAKERADIRRRMNLPPVQSSEKARRDERIVELHLKGVPVPSIAEEVGVTDRTVHRATSAYRRRATQQQQEEEQEEEEQEEEEQEEEQEEEEQEEEEEEQDDQHPLTTRPAGAPPQEAISSLIVTRV